MRTHTHAAIGLPKTAPDCKNSGMNLSESEVVALMTAAVFLNAVGFIAWKRGAVGQWYLYAVGLAVLALLVDPYQFPGLGSSGVIAAFALGLYGLVAWVRHRQAPPSDKLSV